MTVYSSEDEAPLGLAPVPTHLQSHRFSFHYATIAKCHRKHYCRQVNPLQSALLFKKLRADTTSLTVHGFEPALLATTVKMNQLNTDNIHRRKLHNYAFALAVHCYHSDRLACL